LHSLRVCRLAPEFSDRLAGTMHGCPAASASAVASLTWCLHESYWLNRRSWAKSGPLRCPHWGAVVVSSPCSTFICQARRWPRRAAPGLRRIALCNLERRPAATAYHPDQQATYGCEQRLGGSSGPASTSSPPTIGSSRSIPITCCIALSSISRG